MILERIDSPRDLKQLNLSELNGLAGELRSYIIEVMSENGGHLASNLGVIELTLALHYVFDAPEDKLIFDVGHQSYAHKILTGRREKFRTIRKFGGLSGFPKREESEYDVFDTGHSSTAVSAGLGIARARDLAGKDFHVVAVVGDGAISSGMAFEAINDLGQSQTRMIVVLNDNEMSISKNVGALSDQLAKMRVSKKYLRFKDRFSRILLRLPLVGRDLEQFARRSKNLVKRLLVKDLLFEQMGMTYLGPIDGHNLEDMIAILSEAKNADGPVLLHVVTQKGRGFAKAERAPELYHGVGNGLLVSGDGGDNFGACACRKLTELAENRRDVAVITAAMAEGTGMAAFASRYPRQFFDVGIAEQHAVTLAAGMAAGGMRPVAAIYSTFLQRAYDQILHDVCLQNLPVILLVDRGGVSGRDGETHHGIYDLAYLYPMPNIRILAPASRKELDGMLEYALNADCPVAIRYPNGKGLETAQIGYSPRWRRVISGKRRIAVLAEGSRMLTIALHAAEDLLAEGIAISVYNCSTLRPLDAETLDALSGHFLLTMEDGVLEGGFYSQVLAYYAARGKVPGIRPFGFPKILPHGSVQELYNMVGITRKSVAQAVRDHAT